MAVNIHNKLKNLAGKYFLEEAVDTNFLYVKRGHHIKNLLELDIPGLRKELPQKSFKRTPLYNSSGCAIAVLTFLFKEYGWINYEVEDIQALATKRGYFDYSGMNDEGIINTLKIADIECKIVYVKNAIELSEYLKEYYVIANIWAVYKRMRKKYRKDSNFFEAGHYILFLDSFEYNGKKYLSAIDHLSEKSNNPWGYSAFTFEAYDSIRYTYSTENSSVNNFGICSANTMWEAGSIILVKK